MIVKIVAKAEVAQDNADSGEPHMNETLPTGWQAHDNNFDEQATRSSTQWQNMSTPATSLEAQLAWSDK